MKGRRTPVGGEAWLAAWQSSRILCQAFDEHVASTHVVYALCRDVVRTPAGTPPAYYVALDAPPAGGFGWRRHLFSTLFHSTYLLLGVPPERRALYSRINCLFRVWVTAADNLLDGEEKPTLPLRMPASSHVMRQVIAVMAADRVLTRLLADAVRRRVLTAGEADRLSERTLGVLLPSAAQEASEEAGIVARPAPAVVLATIHRLKTGLLFNVPFVGLEGAGSGVAPAALRALRAALNDFGVGCQVLDDIRDVACDLGQRRHNYVLSSLYHRDRAAYDALLRRGAGREDRLYRRLPRVVREAAAVAERRLMRGLTAMRRHGLDLTAKAARDVAASMFVVLDVEDVRRG